MPSKNQHPVQRRRRAILGCSAVAEPLEGRRLLTAVVVNTILDTTGTAQTSLRDAVAVANASTTPTTITFDPIIFAAPQTIALGSPIVFTNAARSTTVTGPAAALTVKGDGVMNDPVLQIGAAPGSYAVQVTLASMTVTNGGGHLGGINDFSTLTLTNVIVTNNLGNGIFANGALTLSDVTVSHNVGNGIILEQLGLLTASGVAAINNGGQGIGNGSTEGATCIIIDSTVSGNANVGIVCDQPLILTNDTVTNNSVQAQADDQAGGIFCATATLDNVTVSGNKGDGLGGSTATNIGNSIIAGNTQADVQGQIKSLGFNLIGNTTGSSGWIASDFTGTAPNLLDPKLGPLANNGGPTQTMVPLSGSLAIDNGEDLLVPETVTIDQRGLPRYVGASVDIGAVEVQSVLTSAPMVTLQPATQAATSGNFVTLTADATASPAPSIQWQVSTDGTTFNNIPGATSPTYAYTFSCTSAQNGDLFRAVFTNALGSATTNLATLTVYAGPLITLQPTNQTVVAGTTATFTAVATGNPTPTVQWWVFTPTEANFAIPGATSPTYSFNAALNQNGDFFYAVFTNGYGPDATTLVNISLTVLAPAAPVITRQPVNTSLVVGQSGDFYSVASGEPAPTVQWQESSDGTTFVDIAGATSNEYEFIASATRNGHQFRAVFTNSLGLVTTNAAHLTLVAAMTPPVITLQPTDESVPALQSVSFAAAATGNPTPSVQWQVSVSGGAFADVAGATSPTYTFTAVAGQNGSVYRAEFQSSQGLVRTNAVTLTVTASQVAPAITAQPNDATAIAGAMATFTAGATGSPTPMVRWQVSTNGATFNDIPGATADTYAFTTSASQNGNLFRAIFTNPQGPAITHSASLMVTTALSAPIIIVQPANQSGQANQSVSFTAAASGNPTPTVQWQTSTDGTTFNDIPGATSALYTLTAAAAQNGNLFRAVFSNSQGSASTNSATLSVAASPIQLAVTTAPPAVMTLGQVFDVVVSAEDSSGGVDPTFTGSITLAVVDSSGNSVALAGPATVTAVNGAANFSGLSINTTGTFTMSASANGAVGTTTANFNVIAVGAPPPAITPSFGRVTIPSAAVVGAPFSGKVPVVVTNSSAAMLKGKFTINVYANANPALDGTQTLVTSVHSTFALKPAKFKALTANVHALPANLSAGAYYTVVQVVDPNGGTSVTASAQPFQLAAARIALNLVQGSVLPATITLNHSGSIHVTVTNTGNTIATGPLLLTLGVSSDGATQLADMTLAHVNSKRFRLGVGKSAKFTLHFKVTNTTATGTYLPYLSLSLAGVMQTGLGATPFTIG